MRKDLLSPGPAAGATRLALFACALTAGCAALTPATHEADAHVVPAAASSSIVAVPAASSVKPSEKAPAVAVAKPAPANAPAPKAPIAKAEPKAEPKAPATKPAAPRAKATPAEQPRAKVEVKAAATPPVAAEPAKAPAVVERKAEPGLNVSDLTEGLKETKAIGAFTKLALKNQLDDLLQKFRTTHQSGQQPRAAGLRQPFDALVGKVTGLLQPGDPALARKIESSREGIWAILSDPEKFKSVT
jgi:hypothetical protein